MIKNSLFFRGKYPLCGKNTLKNMGNFSSCEKTTSVYLPLITLLGGVA